MQCCLCGNPNSIYSEQRNTAENGDPETWHFCPECWEELERQRADTEDIICERYLVFLQFLSGRYRMRRSLQGCQPGKIVPNISIDTITRIAVSSCHVQTKDYPDSGSGTHRADEDACGCGEKEPQRNNGESLPRVSGSVQGVCEIHREGQTETLKPAETEPAQVAACADS